MLRKTAQYVQLRFWVDNDTLVSAIRSGMIGGPMGYAYWCDSPRIGRRATDFVDGKYEDENIARNVLAGGTAFFREFDEATGKSVKTHTLTRWKLVHGVARWAIEHGAKGQMNDDGAYEFEIDAPASDAILQFALFGEQKYG